MSELAKNGYDQELYEPGCSTDWRLWTAIQVNNKVWEVLFLVNLRKAEGSRELKTMELFYMKR